MNRTGIFILATALALPATEALAKGGQGHGNGHGNGKGHAKHAQKADKDRDEKAHVRTVWRNPANGARRVAVTRYGVDSNRDGIITRAEWRGNAQSFAVQDRNGDGIISARDRTYTNTSNVYGANARYGRWSTLDRNGDGTLERWEWPHSGSLFDAIDRNNDGLVSQWELRESVR